jgi:hypothetical protein
MPYGESRENARAMPRQSKTAATKYREVSGKPFNSSSMSVRALGNHVASVQAGNQIAPLSGGQNVDRI